MVGALHIEVGDSQLRFDSVVEISGGGYGLCEDDAINVQPLEKVDTEGEVGVDFALLGIISAQKSSGGGSLVPAGSVLSPFM